MAAIVQAQAQAQAQAPTRPAPAKAVPLTQKLNTRWGTLKSEWSSWDADWKACSQYILPRTGRFLVDDHNKGGARTNLIYDNTATRAARTLAAGMLGGLTSPARPWFRLTTGDAELDEQQSVKLWLADVTRRMQRLFAGSNVYRALHSVYEELGVYGTAAATVLDDFETGIHLYTHTIGEYALATDHRGQVNTIYREFKKTAEQLVTEFGWDNCSRPVQDAYREGRLDSTFTVIHAIEPRTARDHTKSDAKNMAFRSTYFEATSTGHPEKFLRDSGFKRFRTLAPRWVTTGGDVYGGSPGMDALGDVKQLQHQQLRKSQAIDYQTRPPMGLPTALKNAGVDLLPGGTTYLDMAQGSQIGPLMDARYLNLNYLLQDIVDVRGRINAAFYADLFMMLAQSNTTTMTATEVAERHEEKLLMLGPVLERLHNELLDPLIEIAFERLIEVGGLPEVPPEMEGFPLAVDFVSLLAQAQRAIGVNSIDRFVLGIMGVANVRPEVLDKFDADQWADVYADSLGVDPSLVRGDDEVAKIRETRAAQQQQQAAMEQASVMADAAAKVGSVDTSKPNALTDIMGNLTGYGSPAPYNY